MTATRHQRQHHARRQRRIRRPRSPPLGLADGAVSCAYGATIAGSILVLTLVIAASRCVRPDAPTSADVKRRRARHAVARTVDG